MPDEHSKKEERSNKELYLFHGIIGGSYKLSGSVSENPNIPSEPVLIAQSGCHSSFDSIISFAFLFIPNAIHAVSMPISLFFKWKL